jgi:glycerol-3-phosphate dehydrogenase (NAD(P)+)
MPSDIGVVGAGAWGTALAHVLAAKGERVTLWCHGADSFETIRNSRENRPYLAGISLAAGITPTRTVAEAVTKKELVICALPSHVVRTVFAEAARVLDRATILVCATKGLEEGSLKTMGELFDDLFGGEHKGKLAFLSGPTFAIEVARMLPAAVTVAAADENLAKSIQQILSTQSFRVYTSADVIGVQVGGVVKNVIAIAAGISDGLNLGQNARALDRRRAHVAQRIAAVPQNGSAQKARGVPETFARWRQAALGQFRDPHAEQ